MLNNSILKALVDAGLLSEGQELPDYALLMEQLAVQRQVSTAVIAAEWRIKEANFRHRATPDYWISKEEWQKALVFELDLQLNKQELDYLQLVKAHYQKRRRRRWLFWLIFPGLLLGALWGGQQLQQSKTANQQQQWSKQLSLLDQTNCLEEECLVMVVRKNSSGEIRYGFRDKAGNLKIPYQYTEAAPFDEYGYARVKIFEKLYLIDSSNRRFPLAESLSEINDSILAVSLKEQGLVEWPAELVNYPQLQILYLRGNQLQRIPSDIQQLPQLKVLDLSYNKINQLQSGFRWLSLLSILDLSNNQLSAIPESVMKLEHLEYLDLSYNEIKAIDPKIKNMKGLKTLDLSYNNIEKIDTAIAELEQLENLNLYGNQITFVPNPVLEMNLKELNVGGNRLSKQEERKIYKHGVKKNSIVAVKKSRRSTIKEDKESLKEKEEEETLDAFEQNADCSRFWNFVKSNMAEEAMRLVSKALPIINEEAYHYKMSVNYHPSHRILSEQFSIKLMYKEELEPGPQTKFIFRAMDSTQLICRTAKVDIAKDKSVYSVVLYPVLPVEDSIPGVANLLDWFSTRTLSFIAVEYSLSEGIKKIFKRPLKPPAQLMMSDLFDCTLLESGQDLQQQEQFCASIVEEKAGANFKTKALTLHRNSKFEYNMAFERMDGQLFAKMGSNHHPMLKKGYKLAFKNEKEEKRVLTFSRTAQRITLSRKEGTTNWLPLTTEDYEWLSKNRISSISLLDLEKNRMYPLKVIPAHQSQLRRAMRCLGEHLLE